ncbi:MAG: DUF2232 domain-containing protein [Bacilli bacterium]|nr:DUF2232 domain-containing protein [Bacilli bacterium]
MVERKLTKTESLAFTSLLCAIHILIIFASEYLPFFDLIIIFFLPFFSAILTIKCSLKYSFILFFSTMIIGLLIDPFSTLLFITSPLIYGISYGLLTKNKIGTTSILYLLSILSIGLLCFDVYLIQLLYNQNFLEILSSFFHIDSFYQNNLVYYIIILFSFAQSFVIHFSLKYTLKKMHITTNKNKFPPVYLLLLMIVSLIVVLLSYDSPLVRDICYIVMIILAIPYAIYGYQKNKALVPLLISQAVSFLIVIIPLLSVIDEERKYLVFLLLVVPPLLYGIYREFKENDIKTLLKTF